jgi:Fic family protein
VVVSEPSVPAPAVETATKSIETVDPRVAPASADPAPVNVEVKKETQQTSTMVDNPTTPSDLTSETPPQGGGESNVVTPLKKLLLKAKEKIQWRKRQKLDKILALAGKQGKITNNQVEKLLRISDATVTRYLSQLVKEGRLIREGRAEKPIYRLP